MLEIFEKWKSGAGGGNAHALGGSLQN